MPSPLETILIGKVAGYLCANDTAKTSSFQRNALDDNRSVLIWRATEIIEAIYDKDNDYPNLQAVADYLYWLCGGYAEQARRILTLNNMGTVADVLKVTTAGIIGFRIEIQVGNGGEPLVAGDTSYMIDLPFVVENTVKVELPQSNVPEGEINQFSTIPIYKKENTQLIFTNYDEEGNNIGVQNGMLLIITGLRYGLIAPTGDGGGGGNPTPNSNLPIITVFGDEIQNNAYLNNVYVGEKIYLFYNGVKFMKENTDFVRNPLGGFTLIGDYAGVTWGHGDEFIMIPNGQA